MLFNNCAKKSDFFLIKYIVEYDTDVNMKIILFIFKSIIPLWNDHSFHLKEFSKKCLNIVLAQSLNLSHFLQFDRIKLGIST